MVWKYGAIMSGASSGPGYLCGINGWRSVQNWLMKTGKKKLKQDLSSDGMCRCAWSAVSDATSWVYGETHGHVPTGSSYRRSSFVFQYHTCNFHQCCKRLRHPEVDSPWRHPQYFTLNKFAINDFWRVVLMTVPLGICSLNSFPFCARCVFERHIVCIDVPHRELGQLCVLP